MTTIDKKEVQVSSEFKSQAIKAIIAIGLFILTYLIILLLAVGFTVLCIIGGLGLILIHPSLATMVLGLGLASLGILVLIFLLKFIFASNKTDRSGLIEISQDEQPVLFQMIEEIVQEVKTDFPKKVYLDPNVNAAVFYDSGFWSMFFPIKKNLLIGLGLVNTVTKEELRAILAHEFGHFSQKSMKVGTYVYNLNKVVYNMLHDNASYERMITRWADVSGFFALFVLIAVKVNQGIQWILIRLYDIVNISYSGLSREMEFHADEIAASVTGYLPLKTSLLRMPFADHSLNEAIGLYQRKIGDQLKSKNLYTDQHEVILFLAEENNYPVSNGLPDISVEEQSKFDKSKLVIEDQWASHPSTEDRVIRLEKTGFDAVRLKDEPANNLFRNIEKYQQQFTDQIFETIKPDREVQPIPTSKFIEIYKQEFATDSFPKIFRSYYNNKHPISFDLDGDCSQFNAIEFSDLYSDETIDLVYSGFALHNDIETLKMIADDKVKIKTFDYNGIKYKKKDASHLIEQLNSVLHKTNEKIRENDFKIYCWFRQKEVEQKREELLNRLYSDFFEFDKDYMEKYNLYIKMHDSLQFINYNNPTKVIINNFKNLQPIEESLKHELSVLLAEEELKSGLTEEVVNNLEKYLSENLEYFGVTIYLDDNLSLLFSSLEFYAYLLFRKHFQLKKSILLYQEGLIKER